MKSRWILQGLGVWFGLISAPGLIQAASTNDFIPYNYDFLSDGTTNMPGMLFVPTNYVGSTQSFPLVIYLHGSGQRLKTNFSNVYGNVTSGDINNLAANAKARNFFLYAPQEPDPTDNWLLGYLENVMRMSSRITRDYNVSPDRIYVTGLSMGGAGTYTVLSHFFDIIAGAVPISANYGDANIVSKMVDTPMWIYHARDDTSSNIVKFSRDEVNNIRIADGKVPIPSWPINTNGHPFYNNGSPYFTDGSTYLAADSVTNFNSPKLHYTEYATGGHTVATWGRAYNETNLYNWLLTQSKTTTPPQLNEVLLFDFGQSKLANFTADGAGRMWNGTTYNHFKTKEPILPFAMTSVGRRTRTSMDVLKAFGSDNAQGPTSVGAPLNYISTVAQDGWVTVANASATNNYGEIAFRGLQPSGAYQVKIWASNLTPDGTHSRQSRYEIGGVTRDLAVDSNTTNTALFSSAVADATGKIQLKVYATPGTNTTTNSRYGQINALELSPVASLSAVNDTQNAFENTPVDIDVLANDGTGSSYTIQSYTNPTSGRAAVSVVTVAGKMQIHYVPEEGYYTDLVPDSFTYTMTDGSGSTSTASVAVTVNSTATANDLILAGGLTGANISVTGDGSSRVLATTDWEVNGSGYGLSGTADSFHYEAADRTGDFQMTVRMKSLTGIGPAARGGLMLRESNDPDARMIYLSTTTGGNYRYGSRNTIGGAVTEVTPADTYSYPNSWLLLKRVGSTVLLAVSNDGQTYQEVASLTLSSLTASVKAGLFSSSGQANVNTRAVMSEYDWTPLATPLSFWKLDETTGTTAVDAMGFQNGGLSGNAAWTTGGRTHGGIALDGTNDWVQVADRPEFGGSALSASLWFKPSILDGNPRALISKRANPTTARAFGLYLHTGNKLFVSVGDLAPVDTGYVVPAANQWYHTAMVFDGALATGRLKVYINGALIYAGQPSISAIPDTYAQLYIGILNTNYGYSFQGVIDEVQMYNTALTPENVAALAQ
jgi:hypothetical protein